MTNEFLKKKNLSCFLDKKLLGKIWRNVFFLGVNSTNFANFWKNICQFLNITNWKQKPIVVIDGFIFHEFFLGQKQHTWRITCIKFNLNILHNFKLQVDKFCFSKLYVDTQMYGMINLKFHHNTWDLFSK
jgi:hypothetical protein